MCKIHIKHLEETCKDCQKEVGSSLSYAVEDGRLDASEAENMTFEERVAWFKEHDVGYDPY